MLGAGIGEGYGLIRAPLSLVLSDPPAIPLLSKSESESWSPSPVQLFVTPDSSVHGILQARILEWVAISFSRGSFQTGDWMQSPALRVDSLLTEPPGKLLLSKPT